MTRQWETCSTVCDYIDVLVQDCGNSQHINSSPPSAAYESVNWVIIGSGNGLSPVRRQAVTWTNAGLLSIALLGTNFSEIWIEILSFSFKIMHLKMLSAKLAAILSRGRWVNNGVTAVLHWTINIRTVSKVHKYLNKYLIQYCRTFMKIIVIWKHLMRK